MRGMLTGAVAAALLAAGPAATAAADPVPEPAPPSPAPAPAASGDPLMWLGPLDQLAPVNRLAPETYRMPDGEQPSPYVLVEDAPPGPFAFVDGLKGVHAVLHGALGRMPGADLGTALPGTAPPPGTALPPGLEEYLPVPSPAPAPPG